MSISETLYRYLVLSGNLPLPGIGIIRVEKNSSLYDVAGKAFTGPRYAFHLEEAEVIPSPCLLSFVSRELQVPDEEAAEQVNHFSNDIKQEIGFQKMALWQGVGIFRKKLDGHIALEPVMAGMEGVAPVKAEKVFHENVSHSMLVGDTETTSGEMAEFFNAQGGKRDFAWITALILLGISLLFLVYYFSNNGFSPAALGL